MNGYRGRFAPSPSGPLHFGSLVAALGSWLRARAAGGRWLVRIEDLDRARCSPRWTTDILATLAAFGLEADEPVVLQSARESLYEAALARLREAGHAYPCACSRSDLEAFAGLHPQSCVRTAEAGQPVAWRLRVPDGRIAFDDRVCGPVEQALRGSVGDFVLRRANGEYTYQLAVVVDDAAQGISEVVRGADLLDSTPRQILLRNLLGLPDTGWLHLPLVLDAAGRKLAKRDAAHPLDPADPLPALHRALAVLGQPLPAAASLDAILAAAIAGFDIARIPRSIHLHAAMQDD